MCSVVVGFSSCSPAARTAEGEETLARWLLRPAPPENVRARQEAVRELARTSTCASQRRFKATSSANGSTCRAFAFGLRRQSSCRACSIRAGPPFLATVTCTALGTFLMTGNTSRGREPARRAKRHRVVVQDARACRGAWCDAGPPISMCSPGCSSVLERHIVPEPPLRESARGDCGPAAASLA